LLIVGLVSAGAFIGQLDDHLPTCAADADISDILPNVSQLVADGLSQSKMSLLLETPSIEASLHRLSKWVDMPLSPTMTANERIAESCRRYQSLFRMNAVRICGDL
jgi:hypothetical protein